MSDKFEQQYTENVIEQHASSELEELPDHGRRLWVRCLMQVLWPAFLGAALTVGLVFSLIDPSQLDWVHTYLHDSREAAYTVGFIVFWFMYSVTCTLTWFLATTETPTGRVGFQRSS